MLTAKVTQKGQITIPKKIRDWLQVGPEDEIIFVRRGDEVVMKRVSNLLTLRGSVKVDGPQDFEKIRQQVIKSIAEHAGNE